MADFTKKAIKESFMKLLNERPLNKITVKDIVEDCGINRNSFYYHFQDIPALVEEIITDESARLIKECPSLDTIDQAFELAIGFMLKNKTAVMHIFNSVNRDTFERYLVDICEIVMTKHMEVALSDVEISDEDKKLIIRFGKCECLGIIIEWLSNGMKEDILENSKRLFEINRYLHTIGGLEGLKKKK